MEQGVACGYIFDIKDRTLEVLSFGGGLERMHFACVEPTGVLRFEGEIFEALDWRNRRESYGADDPERTLESLVALLEQNLPL